MAEPVSESAKGKGRREIGQSAGGLFGFPFFLQRFAKLQGDAEAGHQEGKRWPLTKE
jgi:hypothetical protein